VDKPAGEGGANRAGQTGCHGFDPSRTEQHSWPLENAHPRKIRTMGTIISRADCLYRLLKARMRPRFILLCTYPTLLGRTKACTQQMRETPWYWRTTSSSPLPAPRSPLPHLRPQENVRRASSRCLPPFSSLFRTCIAFSNRFVLGTRREAIWTASEVVPGWSGKVSSSANPLYPLYT
jgi:hypothetical protein